MPDHDLWMVFFRDGEGNLLGLMSEVRPPAPRHTLWGAVPFVKDGDD